LVGFVGVADVALAKVGGELNASKPAQIIPVDLAQKSLVPASISLSEKWAFVEARA